MLKHLSRPDPPPEKSFFKSTDLCILDPCCGEGEALQILAEGLGIEPDHVYAVELHKARAEAAKLRLPEAHVLGPCSFFGADIPAARFSLAYVNPPFDYSSDSPGFREEQQFLRRAHDLLTPKGLMVLVCPLKALIGNENFSSMVDSMFEDVGVYRFPDEARPYNEICVFGRKRKDQLDLWNAKSQGFLGQSGFYSYQAREHFKIGDLPALGELQPLAWKNYEIREGWNYKRKWEKVGEKPELDVYTLPYSWAPKRFNKTLLTDEERADELARSPLWSLLREPEPIELPRPWIQPAKGHTIMLMVSGYLDGLVPSDPPHVARGHYLKKERLDPSKCKTVVNEETGAVTQTQVYSEEPVSLIRLLEVDEFGEPHIYELRSDAQETEEGSEEGGEDFDEDD